MWTIQMLFAGPSPTAPTTWNSCGEDTIPRAEEKRNAWPDHSIAILRDFSDTKLKRPSYSPTHKKIFNVGTFYALHGFFILLSSDFLSVNNDFFVGLKMKTVSTLFCILMLMLAILLAGVLPALIMMLLPDLLL